MVRGTWLSRCLFRGELLIFPDRGNKHHVEPDRFGECHAQAAPGAWSGEYAFAFADEAARTIEVIDRSDCKVVLVD
jgi:hypothetical protein